MKWIFELSLHFHKNKGFTLYVALFLASGIIFSITGALPGKTQGKSHPTLPQSTSCMVTLIVNIEVMLETK